MDTNTKDITHNQDTQRFELVTQEYTAVLEYMLTDETITFTYTGVPPAIENRGIGTKLVKAGLKYAQESGLRVKSYCWFVSKYIRKHPEYQDLM